MTNAITKFIPHAKAVALAAEMAAADQELSYTASAPNLAGGACVIATDEAGRVALIPFVEIADGEFVAS